MAPKRKRAAAKARDTPATRVWAAKNQEITASNSTESAFLGEIPPELRNRIAELVLGEGTIHVYVRENEERASRLSFKKFPGPGDVNVAVCTHGIPEATFAVNHKGCSPVEILEHHGKHELCMHTRQYEGPEYRRAARQLMPSVALLETCRQLNTEMSLLLFAGNNFVFHQDGTVGTGVFERFMKKLTAAQRNAITSISVIIDDTDKWPAQSDFPATLLTSLTSVRALTLCVVDLSSSFEIGRPIFAARRAKLRCLARLPLESAAVRFVGLDDENEEYDRLASNLETDLLRPWADVNAENTKTKKDAKKRKEK